MKSATSFDHFAADETLVPPGARVLVAVSSGADSMALLCWLHELKRDILVGHVNHALEELRPGECQADENFVREKCLQLKIPFRAVTVNLPRRAGHVNESVAREARYARRWRKWRARTVAPSSPRRIRRPTDWKPRC